MLFSEEDKNIKKLLMKATYELRKSLSIETYIMSYRQSNLQHYYIGTVLDEVMNLETAMIRWDGFFSEDIKDGTLDHPVGISIIQAVSNEVQMYRRKNIEILAKLILFQSTNRGEYYKHYILISEYNSLRRRINDFKAFYSIVPNNEEHTMIEIVSELMKSSKAISEDICWFLNDKRKPTNINGVNIRTYENTFQDILLKAIPKADKYEKMALGLSYQRYSEASESIHNNINLNRLLKEETENACRTELLMMALIINKCQTLLNKYPHKANTELYNFISDLISTSLWIAPLFEDIFEKNDYVYANDDALGRIEEVIVSSVGYRSFKIKYLTGQMPEYGQYGNYPAHFLRRIHSRKQLEDILIKNSDEILREVFTKFITEDQMTSGLDNLIRLWWENGYKEKVLYNDNSMFSQTINIMSSHLDKEKIDSLVLQKLEELKKQ